MEEPTTQEIQSFKIFFQFIYPSTVFFFNNIWNLSKEELFELAFSQKKTYGQLTPLAKTNYWLIQGHSPLKG